MTFFSFVCMAGNFLLDVWHWILPCWMLFPYIFLLMFLKFVLRGSWVTCKQFDPFRSCFWDVLGRTKSHSNSVANYPHDWNKDLLIMSPVLCNLGSFSSLVGGTRQCSQPWEGLVSSVFSGGSFRGLRGLRCSTHTNMLISPLLSSWGGLCHLKCSLSSLGLCLANSKHLCLRGSPRISFSLCCNPEIPPRQAAGPLWAYCTVSHLSGFVLHCLKARVLKTNHNCICFAQFFGQELG